MSELFYETRPEQVFIGDICDHPFPLHLHEKLEIVCLVCGSMTMTVGGTELQMQPGDIAVAFPLIPHSYDMVSEDARGLSLIFPPDAFRELEHVFRSNVPEYPFIRSVDPASEMAMMIRSMLGLSPTEDSPLRFGYLHLFLGHMLSAVRLIPIRRALQTKLYYQVLRYISEHFTEPLSLKSTAKALGVSPIHLSHVFSQQLHIGFRQYLNTLRIDLCCTLLRETQHSVSQIAYQCGFGTPRTFHRAFLSQCHMTPRQYRAQFRPAGYVDEEDELFDPAPPADAPQHDEE